MAFEVVLTEHPFVHCLRWHLIYQGQNKLLSFLSVGKIIPPCPSELLAETPVIKDRLSREKLIEVY